MNILLTQEISFPGIGITFDNVPSSFTISENFGLSMYGIFIGIAIVVGFAVVLWQAGVTGQDRETYVDLAVPVILFSVIGARMFYLLFSITSLNPESPEQIFGSGGLSWYGALGAGSFTVFIYCRIKKLDVYDVCDTASGGLLVGQSVGIWGDFFARQGFGRYTGNPLAMRLSVEDVDQNAITGIMLAAAEKHGYSGFIQVHPLFLYESVFELVLFIFLMLYYRYRKFRGEIFLIYLIGYGTVRGLIESMRSARLNIWGTNIPVSEAVSIVMVITCISVYIVKRVNSIRVEKR